MELHATVPDTLDPPYAGRNVATLKVCGVFSSAVYMEDPAENMYLIHSSEYGLLPFGFGVKNISTALALLNTDIGEIIEWSNEKLIFSNGCAVTLRKAALPEPKEQHGCPVSDSALERAVLILKDSGRGAVPDLITKECINGERAEGSVYVKMAREPLQCLLDGFEYNSPIQISQALSRLIGLGPGLTPSMDDFLTGALCTLHYANKYWGVPLTATETLSKSVQIIAPQRTGKYSQAYLLAAVQGNRFQIIEQVLSSFSEHSIRSLLNVGGHSGADILTGILWVMKRIVKAVK